MDSMKANITEALQAKKVQVEDVYGDGRHVQIAVVSDMFEGKSQMNRQRMVYKVRCKHSKHLRGCSAPTARSAAKSELDLSVSCHLAVCA